MGLPIIGDIIDSVQDLVSEAIVDKDKKTEIALQLEEIKDRANQRLHEELMAQTDVNKEEAGHRSIFVAGWRPFIGWTGGAGLAWTFVVGPVAEWISRLAGWEGEMPVIDTGTLMTLVTAMLGMGVMRSFDKAKGVSNDVLSLSKPKTTKLPENAPWAN